MLNFMNAFKKKQDGSVIIVAALLMSVILGLSALVLDIGIIHNARSKLQNELDSSALAAIRELPVTKKSEWDIAVEVAKKYAELNGYGDNGEPELIVKPLDAYRNPINVPITNLNAKNINGIQVSGDTNVNYIFAKIFGSNGSSYTLNSKVELATVEGATGLLPVAMSEYDFNILYNLEDTSKIIKFDGSDNKELGLTGWRGAVNFLNEYGNTADGGKYQDCIIDGYEGVVVSGEDEVTLNKGVMNITNLPDRYVGHESCFYSSADEKVYYYEVDGVKHECVNCPRIVAIPLIDYVPTYEADGKLINVQGKTSTVVALGTIWITNITSKIIEGYPISKEYVAKGARAGVVLNDYGLRAVRLFD